MFFGAFANGYLFKNKIFVQNSYRNQKKRNENSYYIGSVCFVENSFQVNPYFFECSLQAKTIEEVKELFSKEKVSKPGQQQVLDELSLLSANSDVKEKIKDLVEHVGGIHIMQTVQAVQNASFKHTAAEKPAWFEEYEKERCLEREQDKKELQEFKAEVLSKIAKVEKKVGRHGRNMGKVIKVVTSICAHLQQQRQYVPPDLGNEVEKVEED